MPAESVATRKGSMVDMDEVTAIREEPDHFVVTHAKRGPHRVPKAKITADIADSIRSIAAGKAAAAEAIANEPGADGVTHAARGSGGGTALLDDAEPPAEPVQDPALEPAGAASFGGLTESLGRHHMNTTAPDRDALAAGEHSPAYLAALGLARAGEAGGDAMGPGDAPDAPAFTADPGQADLLDPNRVSTAAPFTQDPRYQNLVAAGLSHDEARTAIAGLAPPAPPPLDEGDHYSKAWLAEHPWDAPKPAGAAAGGAGSETGSPAVTPGTPASARAGGATAARPGASGAARQEPPPAGVADTFSPATIDEAVKQEQGAIAEHGRIAAALATEQARIQTDANAAMRTAADDHNARAAENLAKQQEVADDIAKSPIRTKDVGIGGAIALALGAFGSSLSRSPNFALQIINKKIDDDLAVQKENRHEKNNRLAFYERQGMSIENAWKLAKADKIAEVDGHLRAAALASGSATALATAQELSAKGKIERERLVQEAHASHFKMETAPIAFASEQAMHAASVRASDAVAAYHYAQATAERAKKGQDANTRDVIDRLAVGGPVDNRDVARLDPKVAGRVVSLPNGHKFLVQGGEKTAEDTRAVISGASEIGQIVSEAKALRAKFGNEWIDRGAVAGSAGLRERYTLALKNLEHLRAITDNEREIAHALFPDTSSPQTDARVDAMLDQASRGAQVKLQSHLASVGYRGDAATPLTPRRAGQ